MSAIKRGIVVCVSYSRIQPRYTLKSDPEEDVVEEEECHTCRSHLLLCLVTWLLAETQQDGDHEVAEALPGCGIHDHLSSAPAFDVRYADEGKEQV